LHLGHRTSQFSRTAAELEINLLSHARPHLWSVIHPPHFNAALLYRALKVLMIAQSGKDHLRWCFYIFMT
jgi:hypothetical protein